MENMEKAPLQPAERLEEATFGTKSDTRKTLKQIAIILVIIAFVAMSAFAITEMLDIRYIAVILKPIPAFCAMTFFLICSVVLSNFNSSHFTVLCPVIISVCYFFYGTGDVLIAMKSFPNAFLPGGFFFFFGHLIIMTASMLSSLGSNKTLSVSAGWRMRCAVCACLSTQIAAILLGSFVSSPKQCPQGTQVMGFTCWLYISAFSCSVTTGCLYWRSKIAIFCAVLGAHIFLSSDITLFVARFCQEIPHKQLWVMLTYWTGASFLTVAPTYSVFDALSSTSI